MVQENVNSTLESVGFSSICHTISENKTIVSLQEVLYWLFHSTVKELFLSCFRSKYLSISKRQFSVVLKGPFRGWGRKSSLHLGTFHQLNVYKMFPVLKEF
ncbi:hypothetical protein KIL84_008163, partial [Mauremys mutica]